MASKPKRPRDVSQRAKLIVDIATGEVEDEKPVTGKGRHAVVPGQKGGLKGGKARAVALSPKRRKEIARKAALARWSKD